MEGALLVLPPLYCVQDGANGSSRPWGRRVPHDCRCALTMVRSSGFRICPKRVGLCCSTDSQLAFSASRQHNRSTAPFLSIFVWTTTHTFSSSFACVLMGLHRGIHLFESVVRSTLHTGSYPLCPFETIHGDPRWFGFDWNLPDGGGPVPSPDWLKHALETAVGRVCWRSA